jgi:hypothetical protein
METDRSAAMTAKNDTDNIDRYESLDMLRSLVKLFDSFHVTACAFFVLLSGGMPDRADAVNRDYVIDPLQSNIAISGNVTTVYEGNTVGPVNIASQGTGTQGGNSLTTRYTGTILSDRENGTIQFLTGSVIDANSNGSWAPLDGGANGTAPADYGGRATFLIFITANFAGRNFVGDIFSDVLAVNGSNQFPLSSGGSETTLQFTNGNIAYRAATPTPTVGDRSIVGSSGTLTATGSLGLLSQGGRVYETLTIPANTTFQIVDPPAPAAPQTTINLTLTGQIFAKFLIPASNGDYNQNGVVDAADYVVWRASAGQTGVGLVADGNGDNVVNTLDYDYWRGKFGQSVLGAGAGSDFSPGSAVPEPSTCGWLGVVMALAFCRRRR